MRRRVIPRDAGATMQEHGEVLLRGSHSLLGGTFPPVRGLRKVLLDAVAGRKEQAKGRLGDAVPGVRSFFQQPSRFGCEVRSL
jgi:hypothetical protein